MRNLLYLSLSLTTLLLAACGSDSKKSSTLPVDSKERISADFLRNVIANETLDRGFLDRALYTYDELDHACRDSIVRYASSVIDGPMIEGVQIIPEAERCEIDYDRGAKFNVLSGSIARTSYIGIHIVDDMVYDLNGYELDFKDLVLEIEGKAFTLNGRIHQPHAYEDQNTSSDNFSIRDDQGVLYRFSDLKRALSADEFATTQPYAMQGQLELSNIDQPYTVKFDMPTPWQIQAPNTLPTAGELKITDVSEPRKYLTLKATTQPEQSLYSAYIPKKTVARNLNVNWSDILISPSQYRLP